MEISGPIGGSSRKTPSRSRWTWPGYFLYYPSRRQTHSGKHCDAPKLHHRTDHLQIAGQHDEPCYGEPVKGLEHVLAVQIERPRLVPVRKTDAVLRVGNAVSIVKAADNPHCERWLQRAVSAAMNIAVATVLEIVRT